MNALDSARRTLDVELEGIRAVRDSLDGRFPEAVEMLRAALARGGKIVLDYYNAEDREELIDALRRLKKEG